MARGSDEKKRRTWQQRFRRYSRSPLTVAQFCSQEGVSVPSFYTWRQKLHATARSSKKTVPSREGMPAKPAVFQSLTVVAQTPVMTARLPNGWQLDVCVTDTDLVRGVVAELVRGSRGKGEPSC